MSIIKDVPRRSESNRLINDPNGLEQTKVQMSAHRRLDHDYMSFECNLGEADGEVKVLSQPRPSPTPSPLSIKLGPFSHDQTQVTY